MRVKTESKTIILLTAFVVIFTISLFLKNEKAVSIRNIQWNKGINFTAGDCDSNAYTAWCPHNLQYDAKHGKFVFLQSHTSKHIDGEYSNMTLCYLNPETPLDYEMLNCPVYKGKGELLVTDSGEWYIWTDYYSNDEGKNWDAVALTEPLYNRYGVYDIDGILYMGDDSSEMGAYHISYDYGITWSTEYFGVPYKDCEASFCKFKDEIYAFLRTNINQYACIMKKTDEGWIVINDDYLKAGASNCSVVAFDDFIAIAHASRTDLHLYYTVWDGNENFETTDLGLIEVEGDNDLDFHSPSLAFGNGYACIAFMMHTYGSRRGGYYECQNQWMIGAYEAGKKLLKCNFYSDLSYPVLLQTAFQADFFPSGTLLTVLNNSEESHVTITTENLSKYAALHYPNGGLLPVRHGNLAAYGTYGAPIAPENITIDYVLWVQQFPIVEYNGKNYMCIKNVDGNKEMITSIQRKNAVYESSAVVDFAEYTEELQKAFYIGQSSFILTTPLLHYAELSYE